MSVSVRSRVRVTCLLLVGFVGAGAVLTAAPALGQSIRCGNRIVSVGDTSYELQARCGAPDYRTVVSDFRAETILDREGNGVQRLVEEYIDVLTYAGQKGDLPRIITVRRGVIDAIRTGDLVVSTAKKGCAQAVLARRATVGEVHLSCGPPMDRSRWVEQRSIRLRGQVLSQQIRFERWVYDPGPGRLLRILRFENGRLVNVKTGGRSPSGR